MNDASDNAVVTAEGVSFAYGDRVACDDVSFEVARGAVHGFLGPNGSGKSTLFKLLSTAYPLQRGAVRVFGHDLATQVAAIRPLLGVVFQSPALDDKLTVRENLVHGGHLFGLRGQDLQRRIDAMLGHTGLAERGGDLVGALSGGLRRRTELAKGLLAEPRLLLLDEPSTGLDPGARKDLWRLLRSFDDVTILFTTHLMDEAAEADAITILTGGKVVGAGTPDALVREVGGMVVEAECADPQALAPRVAAALGEEPVVVRDALRFTRADAHELVSPLMRQFGDEIRRVEVSHPSLEDVYLAKTGHRFWQDDEAEGA